MSSTALHNVWSLGTLPGGNIRASSTPTPPALNIDHMFLNDLLVTRWLTHHVSKLILLVPPSEARLLNEGLIPMYASMNKFLQLMKDIADKRGVTVPPFSEIPEDYKQEAATDPKLLREQLLPHMSEGMKKYAEHLEYLETEGGQHWASLVAPISVSMDLFRESLATTKASIAKSGTKVPATYTEAILVDESFAQYSERMESEELLRPVRVINEEILKVRSEKNQTGWKEEEAKRNTETELALMMGFLED